MKSCRDITKLIVSGQKLSAFARAMVALHLMMCKACRLFKFQCDSIDEAIRSNEIEEVLDEVARSRIQNQIKGE